MPQIDNDELGRRVFQLQKEKAVEGAIEKMRHALGDQWSHIAPSDGDALKEILGEIWTSIERTQWNSFQFSRLTQDNVTGLAALGRKVSTRHHLTEEILRSAITILSSSIRK